MNKRNALGILACAASAAIAAGNVSNGLYWNGANDTDARVYTGSDDLTSGYWYTYSDDVDGGSSRFIFPADVVKSIKKSIGDLRHTILTSICYSHTSTPG